MLEEINKAAIRFLTPVTLVDTYQEVVTEAQKIIGGQTGSILLYQEEKLNLVYSSADFISQNDLIDSKFIKLLYKTDKFQVLVLNGKSHISNIFRLKRINSLVLLPLRYKDKVIGLLLIHLKEVKEFTNIDINALELFGNLVSLAIRNSLLYEQKQDALKAKILSESYENILERVNKASFKFLLPLSTDETYPIIVSEGCKLIDGQYGSLILKYDSEFQTVFSNLPESISTNIRKKRYTAKVFTDRKILILSNNLHQKNAEPAILALGIKTSIFLPLLYKNVCLGILSINSTREYPLTEKEVNALKLFGSMASLALRKAQLHTETQKAIQTRDLFISMAAHELRTPLTTINGYIQLLRNRLPVNNSPESRWIYELSWESYRLTQLVNELLAVNRIKSGGELQYIFKECSLKVIVNRAISNISFVYPNRIINFQPQLNDTDDIIIGDFDKLLQVITNLIDNAIKYSPVTSEVVLKLKTDPPYVSLIVKDYGQGIPKNEMTRIFDEFYAHHQDGQEGMGLGLFLTRNVINQHHGKIQVYSKVNRGTSVEIKLPKSGK